MKAVTKSIYLFCLILVAFAANSYAQQWTSEQKDVWAGVEKYWQASTSGNAAEFMKYFDDSYMGWDYQAKVPMNKDNTGKWVDYGLKNYTTVVYSLTPLTIWVKGDLSLIIIMVKSIKIRRQVKKKPIPVTGLIYLMKEGGVWKLIGDHGGRTSKPSSN